MIFSLSREKIENYEGDAIIALIHQDGPRARGALSGIIRQAFEKGGFEAAANEVFQIFPYRM